MRPVATTLKLKAEPVECPNLLTKLKQACKTIRKLKGGGKFPQRQTPIDRIRQWLISPKLQLAAQVAIAQTWAGCFTFVRPLQFTSSCLAGIFVLAITILLSPHSHLGCHFQASGIVMFAAWVGPVYAGCIASLARTPGSAYTGALVTFGIVGYIPIAALRASPGNPGPGLITALLYGIALIDSITYYSVGMLWHQLIAYLIAAMLISVSATVLATSLVLTTSAGNALRRNTSNALQGIGQLLSSYAGGLLPGGDVLPRDGSKHLEGEIHSRKGVGFTDKSRKNLQEQMFTPEEGNSRKDFLNSIRRRSDPHKEEEAVSNRHPSLSIKQLRSILTEAKAFLGEAGYEPAVLQKGPQVSGDWKQVIQDSESLLTRVITLELLLQGGHLLNSELLLETCDTDPLPLFRLVFSQLAVSCRALSQAIADDGKPEAKAMLLSVPWQRTKSELAQAVDIVKDGYWSKHRRTAASNPKRNNEPRALEVRVLFFLVTLVYGIITALSDLEQSVPKALGYTMKEVEAGNPADLKPSASKADASEDATDPHVIIEMTEKGECINGGIERPCEPSVLDGTSGKQAESQLSDVSVRTTLVKDDLTPMEALRTNLDFLLQLAKLVCGIDAWLRLKGVFWEEASKALTSVKGFRAALKSKNLQYGFKFWLASSIGLALTITLTSNFPNTRSWRLYYGYITVIIIMIEKVEAAAWKIVQRLMGTLIGGTIGYLIMLREDIHNSGVAVLALVCFCTFVIAQGLHTAFKYTFFLTLVTMSSLTICQYTQCSMAVSWLILPWYASDEHLANLAAAYVNAGHCCRGFYQTFHAIGKAAAEGEEMDQVMEDHRLEGELESKVVRPVEATMLGLAKDTVYWQRGLLASPLIVERLTEELRALIIRLAAMELATAELPPEAGKFSPSIYRSFILPMHEDNSHLADALVSLVEACEPILTQGSTAERVEKVESALSDVENCRANVMHHFQRSKENQELLALKGETGPHNRLTVADSIRLSSWITSASKVFDQISLIARLIVDGSCVHRDNHLTSLLNISGSRKQL